MARIGFTYIKFPSETSTATARHRRNARDKRWFNVLLFDAAMKRTALTLTLTLSLLFSMATTMQVVEVVDANPLPPSWMNPKMTITIQSPLNGTHNALPVSVNFTAQCSWQFSLSDNPTQEDWIKAFYYVLDGQNLSSSGINFTDTQLTSTHPTDTDNYYDYSGQAYLTNLTDGSHSITVYWGVLVNVGTPAEFIVYNESWSATSQFYVNTEVTPELPLFSLWMILPLFMVATLISAIYFKKRKR